MRCLFVRFIQLLGIFLVGEILSCGEQTDHINIDEIKIKQTCEIDAECVGDWWVGSSTCGNIERCIDHQCQTPLSMSGEISNLKQENLYATLSCSLISHQNEKIILERKVEWARGEFALTRGLMCRKDLLDDWAMGLFFINVGAHEMTMHLMQFPIVLIALDANGKVLDVLRLSDQIGIEKNLYVTPKDTQIVIEMKANQFHTNLVDLTWDTCLIL